MSIIEEAYGEKYVRMAYLGVVCAHTVNGVADLHTNIIKNTIFKDFYNVSGSLHWLIGAVVAVTCGLPWRLPLTQEDESQLFLRVLMFPTWWNFGIQIIAPQWPMP